MDTLKLNQSCISKINAIKKRELLDDEHISKIILIALNDYLSVWLRDIKNDYR